MKSIFGISNLSVSPPFSFPIYDKNNYKLAQMPHDTTLVISDSIVIKKITRSKPIKIKYPHARSQKLNHVNNFVKRIFTHIKK